MRIVAHVGASYVLLLLAAVVWPSLPFGRAVPDFVALSAAYLGLTARDRVAPAVAGAVIVGYLADLLMGTPHGILSIAAGVTCLAGHLIQGRLLVRGWMFTAVFSALTATFSGLLLLSIAATVGLPIAEWRGELWIVFWSAVLTAVAGPIQFRLYRMLDSRFARTQRERTAALEGLMR